MEQNLIYELKDDIHEIRRKIDEEIDLRGFSRSTKESYTYHIMKFLEFSKKPAKLASLTDARRYVLYLKKMGKKHSTINLGISAIKFLYRDVWKRKSFNDLKRLKSEKHVPRVIRRQDIERMIKSVPNMKHKLLIELLYSSGVRISEAVKLKIEDVNIGENIALIRKGKGAKDRYVILSDRFRKRFLDYIRIRREREDNNQYVFGHRFTHITSRTGEAIVKQAAAKAGIKNVFPHAFRSSFATHMFDNGEAEFNIQKLLGHADISTTRHYTQSSARKLRNIKSPMDY